MTLAQGLARICLQQCCPCGSSNRTEYGTHGGVYLGRSAAKKTLVHEMAGMLALGCAAHAAYLQPSLYGTPCSITSIKSLVTRLCSSDGLQQTILQAESAGSLELVLDRPSSTNQPNLFNLLNRLCLRASETGLCLKHTTSAVFWASSGLARPARCSAVMLHPLTASLSGLARPAQTAGPPVQHVHALPGLSPAGHAASASHAHLVRAHVSGKARRRVETRVATLVRTTRASVWHTSPVPIMWY